MPQLIICLLINDHILSKIKMSHAVCSVFKTQINEQVL